MRAWLKILIFTFVAGMAGTADAAKAPPGGGNRFLFVVDTSSAMARLEHGGRQAVFDLVYGAARQHMQQIGRAHV